MLVDEVLLKITEKMKEKYISSILESCNICMVSFDLWMPRVEMDTFVLIVHFLNDSGSLVMQPLVFWNNQNFWECHGFANQWSLCKTWAQCLVIAYVKDEGFNLLTMATALTFIVSCEVLGLTAPFVGHAMFKCCQHAINDSKVCVGLTSISIKKHNPFCRKLSHGPKVMGRDEKSGSRHVCLVCPHGNSRLLWKSSLLLESFCFNRLWNSNTQLPYVMEGNNHWPFKVVCRVHKFGL